MRVQGFATQVAPKDNDDWQVGVDQLLDYNSGRIAHLRFEQTDLASSQTRCGVANSRKNKNENFSFHSPTNISAAIRGLVLLSVANYIDQHGLYC